MIILGLFLDTFEVSNTFWDSPVNAKYGFRLKDQCRIKLVQNRDPLNSWIRKVLVLRLDEAVGTMNFLAQNI